MDGIISKLTTLSDVQLQRVNGFINKIISLSEKKVSDSRRYSLFPLRDEMTWEMYCIQEAQTWTAKELEFKEDKNQFPTLPKRIQDLFYNIFGFFAPGDGLVSENILRFAEESEQYEETMFFIKQLDNEMTHAESYGMTIVSIIPEEDKRNEIFELMTTLDCVKSKGDFMKKYIDSDLPRGLRYLAAACMEGIFFVDLFAIIFYFRDDNYLPNFIFLNEQVRKDETLHRDFYCLMTKRYLQPSDVEKVYEIIDEAIQVEIKHVEYLLKEPINSVEEDAIRGITVENLCIYSKMLADQILELCGLPKKYNVEIRLPWMLDANLSEKTNFYEGKVGNYKRFNVKDAVNWKSRAGLDGSAQKVKTKIKF